MTYTAEVLVEIFDISVDNFERVQLILTDGDSTHEKQRRIAAVDHPRIWENRIEIRQKARLGPMKITVPWYSRKLHCLGLRSRTSWVTSRTIRSLAFNGIVANHFCSLTLPNRKSTGRS